MKNTIFQNIKKISKKCGATLQHHIIVVKKSLKSQRSALGAFGFPISKRDVNVSTLQGFTKIK